MIDIITGIVKWFNTEKGYGFITTADRGDIFVHLRALAEGRTALTAGDPVYFSINQTERGAEAANVRVGTPPAPPKPALATEDLADPLPAYASMRMIGRPAMVRQLTRADQPAHLVACTLEIGAEPSAALPKSLPAPSATTACLVLMSIKHWRRVADALDADEQDALVVDGYASLDPLAPGMITLRATGVTTTAILNAQRAAQALRDKRVGEPDAQSELPGTDAAEMSDQVDDPPPRPTNANSGPREHGEGPLPPDTV